MLKHAQVGLDLLTDFEKITLVKSGIRGCSTVQTAYAQANTYKHTVNFDKQIQPCNLTYLDAINLYGWAMSQYLLPEVILNG